MTAPRDCPFQEDVLLLEDGELAFERHMQVEAHVAVCDDCATLEETLHVATETLRALEDAPLGAVEAALARLPSRRRPAVPWAAATAAAAAALFVAVLPLLEDAPAREPVVPVAQELPQPVGVDWDAATPLAEMLDAVPAGNEGLLDRIAGLVSRGGAARGAELARALATDDPARCARAFDVAERAPSTQLAAPLIALLEDADLRWSGRAARLLGRTGAPSAVGGLADALDGAAGDAALAALARMGSAEAYETLSRRAATVGADASRSVLAVAAEAAPATGARLLLELAAADETRAAAWSVLEQRSETLLPPLRDLAAGADALVAAAAAEALGVARDAASVELLAGLTERRVTGRPAVRALLRIGTEASFRAAIDAATVHAAVAPEFDGVGGAEPLLAAVVGAGSGAARRTAIALLARCGGAASAPVLERRALPRTLHLDAVRALGALGGDAAVAALADYAEDATLRGPVIEALGDADTPAAVPELLRLTRRGEARRVARALGRLEHAASARALVAMVRHGPASRDATEALVGLPAQVVVPVLIDALDAPLSRRLRRILARIAGADHGASAAAWKAWWETHT